MSCQCRRNCPARAFIGSGHECIIHERNALNPASASVRLALSAWMSCRRSRIPHALAVFDRRFAGSRLTSGCGSVRLDSFPGHRYFVRLSGGLSPASALRALSTASLACLTTWNPSMILAALGKWPRMALGESQAHVARHQAHAVWVAVVRHEIVRELFHRGRVLARHHADHVALRQVGDDGDAPVAPASGLVDADRLHARAVLVRARLVRVMADEAPRSRVVLADLFGDVRDRLAFRQFHDHRLEQERGRRCPDALMAPSRSSRRAPGTPPVARRCG